MSLPTIKIIAEQVRLALLEDIGVEDVTACLLPDNQSVTARLISREAAILCGQAWFNEVFKQLDPEIQVLWQAKEGEALAPNQIICTISGQTKAILTGERCAMNFLQTLSATATTTQYYVDAVKGTGVRILDTRKTIPNLRLAQKYAVTCGGGANHRFGLYDAILIKENHIKAAGSITKAVTSARLHYSELEIQTEVENLNELQEALASGVQRILLDNFSINLLKKAVELNATHSKKARLEASGGIELAQLRKIAETGIDDISIGAITKHIQAIDLSLRFN